MTNYKGVESLTLQPEGSHLVQITGKNGSGKSSYLDAVAAIIESRGVKLTPKPIREGADSARAEIITDDVKLVRTWKKNDAGTLTAFTSDGARYPSGLEVVKQLTGGQMFEPFAFVSLPEKKQREELLRHVDLDIDLDEVAEQRSELFDARTEVNRDVKRLEGALESLPSVPEDTPDEPVSVAELSRRLSDAQEEHREYDALVRQRDNASAEVDRIRSQIDDLKIRLQQQESLIQDTNSLLVKNDLPDIEFWREKLESADELNAQVRVKQECVSIASKLDEARDKANKLTSDIFALDQSKAKALAKAEFPVPGLSVDDEQILVDGVPFKQVNTAEQVAVSFALATSGERDLRLVIIREGSLLDDSTLNRIYEVAAERDYLVLVECVDQSDQVGFVLKGKSE